MEPLWDMIAYVTVILCDTIGIYWHTISYDCMMIMSASFGFRKEISCEATTAKANRHRINGFCAR